MAIGTGDNATPGRLAAGRTASPAVKRGAPLDENAFRSAQRHSSRVRALKVLLPVAATLMLALFFGYTYLVAPSGFTVNVAGSGFSDGKLVMANPKLEGFTKDNLPYSMTAVRAVQDIAGGSAIALEDIDARVPVGPDNWAAIDAPSGLYDKDANTLDITSEMTVTTTDGMVARLKSATIEIDSGNLTTSDPVDIAMKGTHIAADSLTVLDNGKVFVFDSRVKVTIGAEKPTNLTEASGGDG